MKYLYTKPMCGACEKRKKEIAEGGKPYVLRDAARLLQNDSSVYDDIDTEAFLKLQMQNLTFPVEVDIVDK
jgi:hypothetical protein